MNAKCDNCGLVTPEDKLNEIKDLSQRIDAGSEVPDGECPACGALAYLVDDENEECTIKALKLFVETINATGGLIVNDAGETAPAADEDWTDLADAYLVACDALGVEPWNVEREALDAIDGEVDE